MPALPPLASPAPAVPSPARTALLTVVALIAFAGNSLLCRVALKQTGIDAASFTSVRLTSGALVLALLVLWRARGLCADDAPTRPWHNGNWTSAGALFVYAAGFSFAYISLSAATGALLLFGVVQTSMIGWGLWRGERLQPLQWLGLIAASAGLVWLLLPGLATPSLSAGLLMASAGVAWAVYTLRGRGAGDATAVTAGNFLRATPLALALSALLWTQAHWDAPGLLLALASGALASGLGYAVWYTALRGLTATRAAILQLTVPALATAGGVLLLGEPLSPQLLGASVAVLGGVALVIAARAPARR
ncbi:MAG: DMT family transporter [Aquabacterium sp.]|nr:DMT family transporter [Aquabacterium sp.]